jgi:deoxyhypusine synthase
MHEPPSGDPEGVIRATPIDVGMSVTEFVERAFLAGSAGRLRDAARALADALLTHPHALLGLSLDGPLFAAGDGVSSITPLLRGGYVDWIATTGENLFDDACLALGHPFHRRPPEPDAAGWRPRDGDLWVRDDQVETAAQALREILAQPDFQRAMGTAEMHGLLGAHLRLREKSLGVEYPSLLSTAHELEVPIYNPAPVDNRLGAIVAELAMLGNRLVIDTSIDLNEAAAIVNGAGRPAPLCALGSFGEGPAARFMRRVPQHVRAILGEDRCGEYHLDLRVNPAVAPAPETAHAPRPRTEVRVDTDLTVALPLLTAFILDRVPPRPLKRLGARRDEFLDRMRQDRLQATLKRPLPGF